MDTQGKGTSRRYSAEFKERAVRMVHELLANVPPSEVAEVRFCIDNHLAIDDRHRIPFELGRELASRPSCLLFLRRTPFRANHRPLSRCPAHGGNSTGVQVYFCDPQSPWQRGSNENTNGLLRQYFPKGTDMASLTQGDLDAAADSLNRRPRQTLGGMTPSDKLAETLQ